MGHTFKVIFMISLIGKLLAKNNPCDLLSTMNIDGRPLPLCCLLSAYPLISAQFLPTWSISGCTKQPGSTILLVHDPLLDMIMTCLVYLDSLNSFLRSRDDCRFRKIKHTTRTIMAIVMSTIATKATATPTIVFVSLPGGSRADTGTGIDTAIETPSHRVYNRDGADLIQDCGWVW